MQCVTLCREGLSCVAGMREIDEERAVSTELDSQMLEQAADQER